MVDQYLDILLMNDNNLEVVGGAEQSTKIIMESINNKYKTGIIAPGEMNEENIKVNNFFSITKYTRLKHLIKNPLLFLKYVLDIRKIILKTKPKVIHTQAQASFFIVAFLKKMRLIPSNIYLIHTERGLFTKYTNRVKNIFYFFFKDLDVLITTTNFNMKYWKNILKTEKISLDYRIIENTAGKLFETLDEKYIVDDSDKLTIGFSGRYADWKNWPLAVEIVEELDKIIGDKLKVKMTVGCLDKNSLDKTQSMFNHLKKRLGKRFMGEINVDFDQMNEFYYDVDIFILTSDYNTESFGRTLVEAMSRKTAVLTTNAGGSVEVVGNKNNVCNSTDEFVNRILYFYKSNNNELEFEKEKNLERVKQKYSLKNNIEKHEKLYSEYLAKAKEFKEGVTK